MKKYTYSDKEEAFCQGIVDLKTQLVAYRDAYSAENMKDTTVRTVASKMMKMHKIITRVNQLRIKKEKRNAMTIDELIVDLASMVRFDPSDMYKEDGALKSIHDMPKAVRQMMASFDVAEITKADGAGKPRVKIGELKKVKLIDKLGAMEKLLRHFGAYKEDNKQKTSEVVMFQLPNNERNIEDDELF